MRRLATVTGFGLLGISVPLFAIDRRPANLLQKGGHSATRDDARRITSALAIREGRIEAAGSDQDVAHCTGTDTKIIGLRGRTVLPGFIDVHTHAVSWAKEIVRGEVDAGYPTVHTIAEIQAAVAEHARTSKPGAWVLGSNWDDGKLAEHRYLNKGDLDAVAPNIPVYLSHVSGHLAVANRAALKAAGIDANTPDPPGGVIERDAKGEPTGIVKDRAMNLIAEKIPAD